MLIVGVDDLDRLIQIACERAQVLASVIDLLTFCREAHAGSATFGFAVAGPSAHNMEEDMDISNASPTPARPTMTVSAAQPQTGFNRPNNTTQQQRVPSPHAAGHHTGAYRPT